MLTGSWGCHARQVGCAAAEHCGALPQAPGGGWAAPATPAFRATGARVPRGGRAHWPAGQIYPVSRMDACANPIWRQMYVFKPSVMGTTGRTANADRASARGLFMAEPPRESKDRSLRWLFDLAVGCTLEGVQVHSPRLVRVLPSVVSTVQVRADEVDKVFEAEDGSIWHLEFQQGGGGRQDTIRLATYHLALAASYAPHAVHTVIFWGRGAPPARRLVVEEVEFRPTQVFVGSMDGAALLSQLLDQTKRGILLAREQLVAVALLPLMRHRESMLEVLRHLRPVVETLTPELQRPVMGAVTALAYSRLTPEEKPRIREVLIGMALAEEFFRDMTELGRQEGWQQGLEQGRQQGRQQGLRETLLDGFSVRFGAVPAVVREAVDAVEDLDRLRGMCRAVLRAKDQAEAQRAVLSED